MATIVSLQGGLGNQMFQYALALSLRKRGKDVLLDISSYEGYGLHNGYELERVFGIEEFFATQEEIQKCKKRDQWIVQKIRYKLFGRKYRFFYEQKVSKHFHFDPHRFIYNKDNFCIRGYWQSENFFVDNKEEVLKAFSFKAFEDEKNIEMFDRIKACNAVSIHIRRGDYINHPNLDGICTESYYRAAMEYMAAHVDEPMYFIFSDDIAWCREIFIQKNIVFVNLNHGTESYKDMQLMSTCRHNILANSSFSWWSAYLNTYKEKITIAPKKWFNEGYNTRDLYPDKWIKL
jgi:hypothetical protein